MSAKSERPHVSTARQFTGITALQSHFGSDYYVKDLLEEALGELWGSSRRPSIKPDRRYEIRLFLSEIPEREKGGER